MTFAGNTTAIVELNSQHGVDGSVARSAIPEGYCEEMENADISTAGVTKKRPGYHQIGQRLNNRLRKIRHDVGNPAGDVYAYEYKVLKSSTTVEAYSSGFVPSLLLPSDANCVTLRFLDSSGNPITDISKYTVLEVSLLTLGAPTPLLNAAGETVGTQKYTFCPLDVVNGYAIISYLDYDFIQPHLAGLPVRAGLGLSASTSSVPVGICVGPSMYRLDHTNITACNYISFNAGNYTYDFIVDDSYPVQGLSTYYFDVYGTLYTVQTAAWTAPNKIRVVIRAALPSVTGGTYVPRTLGVYMSPEGLLLDGGSNPILNYISANSFRVRSATDQQIWRPGQYLGAPQAIDGLESYYSLETEAASLVAISEGSLHGLSADPAFHPSAKVGVYAMKVVGGSGAPFTVAKTGTDSYVLSAWSIFGSNNSGSTVAAGDTFTYSRAENGVLIDTPLEIISAVNNLGSWTLTLKWDTELYGAAPSVLNLVSFNKYPATNTDAAYLEYANATPIPVQLGELWEFQDSTGAIIPRIAMGAASWKVYTFSPSVQSYPMKMRKAAAWNPIPACKEWRDGIIQSYPIYLRTRGGSTDSVATSVPYQSSLIVSSIDDPCMRYDGDTMFSMAFFRPQVMSHRSIPGSKGYLPIEQGKDNAKIGAKVEVAFTYSYTDKYGRTLESEPALFDDGIAIPKAAADGTDVAEVLEFSIVPLPQGCMLPYDADDGVPSRRMKLNTYIRSSTQSQDGKYDYLLYKSQDASFLYIQTVTVGDTSTDFLDGTKLEFVALPNTPAPAVKFLTQAANHLVGLGSRTYPYMKVSLDSVFASDGYIKLQSRNTLKTGLGLDISATPQVYGSYVAASVVAPSSPEFRLAPACVGKPPIMDDSTTYCLTGANGTGITVAYSDWSHTFTGTFGGAGPSAGTNYKFRLVGGKRTGTLDIDITKSNFEYASLLTPGATNRFVGKSKWINTDISSGIPQALAGKKFCLFQRLPTVVQGTEIAKSSFIASNGNELRYYTLRTAGTVVGSPLTAGKYYLFDGLETAGNIKASGDDTQLLSWDSDLTFLAGAQQNDPSTDGASLSVYFVLTPVYLKEDNTFATKSVVVSAQITTTNQPRFSLYELYDATTISNSVSTLGGFTNPVTTATLTANRVSDIFTNADIGSYALLEPANGEANRFYSDYPAFKGAVLISDLAGDILSVTVAPSADILTRVSDSFPLTSAYSRLFNLRTMFPAGKLPSGAVANVSPHTAFFQFRGYDYNSTALQISGHFNVTSCDGTWATIDNLPTVALNRISGLALSYTIPRSVDGDIFPIPQSRALAEALQDLALPVYSPNGSITDSPYVQSLKRFGLAMNTVYGNHCHIAYSSMQGIDITVAPNEIAIFQPQKEYIKVGTKLSRILSTYSASFSHYLFTGYDAQAKRVITNGDASAGVEFYQDDYPNRFYWTKAPGANVVSAEIQAFRREFFYDLITEDDSPITGATAFNDSLLIFKKDSIWKITFDADDTISAPVRVQSPVGSYSHHNLPSTLDTCYFLHTSGVYTLDSQGVNNVFKLSRLFDRSVNTDPGLLSLTAGYVDHQKKIAHVGVPYTSDYSSAIAPVDGQFAYSYNDGVLGWTVNTHIDALKFVRHNAETYFASSRGAIFKMSSGTDLEKYRDGDSPIPFALKTRYTNAGENVRFKMFRQFLFQYGGDSKFDMAVYYSTDYKTTVTPLETYTMDNQSTEGNRVTYGNGRFLKTLRESFGTRVNNISFTFTDSSYDSDCAIYSVNLEGLLIGNKLVDQQRTPGNIKSQKRSRT